MCSTNNEEFHFSYSTLFHIQNPAFLPHIFRYDVCTIERGFSLCLWENEFSTTFFIFHIIYQKQINININAGSGKKENLCEIQVSHLKTTGSHNNTFPFWKGELLLSKKDVVVLLVCLFELNVFVFLSTVLLCRNALNNITLQHKLLRNLLNILEQS